jgi:hypothetical protein
VAKTFEEISEHHRDWVSRQSMFFVATAPLGGDGQVNVSPKGTIGSLRILGPRRVAYLDVGGSGAETIAHIRENGRIVFMLCAFDGPPRILRFHGRATVVVRDEQGFEELLAEGGFEDASLPEARRAIIDVEVTRISDSCGYTVPLMSFDGVRDHHQLSTAKRIRNDGVEGYWRHRLQANATSIDGLPALADRDPGRMLDHPGST